jgi:hypothetical protein
MTSFLITCTNATCAIPEAHRDVFKGSEDLVASTEGWEPGALNLAQGLAMKFSTPLIHGDVTRLLIDLEQDGENRWSPISAKLPEATRDKLVTRLEEKFCHAIEVRLAEDFKRHDAVIHLLIHTAPLADGRIHFEHTGSPLAETIASAAAKLLPHGEVDSVALPLAEKTPFVRWLSESFACDKYGIIRVSVAHSFFLRSAPIRWETIKKALIQALFNAAK